MKSYRVHFSFYSEEQGCFDGITVKVDAESPLAARRAAWPLCDGYTERPFMSCVKQMGVTWDDASPLNIADYFRSIAANEKCQRAALDNIKLPNVEIRMGEKLDRDASLECAISYGNLTTIDAIANDLGRPFGLKPPSLNEELIAAWDFVGELDKRSDHDKALDLAKHIELAEKWDSNAMLDIKDLYPSLGR